MRVAKWMTGIGLGTLVVAGLALAPAIHAQETRALRVAKRQVPGIQGGIGGVFTPASADPKLAAVLARSGLLDNGFRFTPSESRKGNSRALTVAVRARSTRDAQLAERMPDGTATTPALSLAPIAYNLGVSVGWKRFAVSGDMTRIDLVTQPGGRERAELGLSYTGKRASGRIEASGDRPVTSAPVMLGPDPSYSIDVGGSYSLTRNLDVTAGVRYRSDRDRLPRLNDDRRDSQAVYVGTAFKF